MCVASLAWDSHPDWLLVAIGNRDEFHERPAEPLAQWDDGSGIIAGKDVRGGGTWLGVSETGGFALVTNYRVPEGPQPGRPTRGKLITDILTGQKPSRMADMNPFNLVHANGEGAWFLTNHPEDVVMSLPPGIHGLSNGGFELPWPKTHQLNTALQKWLGDREQDFEPLFDALRTETPDPAQATPEDGPEPRLAPVFIRDAVYGTRCSTVVTIDRNGAGCIAERRFAPDGIQTGETKLAFACKG